MKSMRLFITLVAALAMILSLSNAHSARAFLPRGEYLAASTPPILSNIKAIDLGGRYTCALTTSGGVLCWGYNDNGQLGDRTRMTHRISPAYVAGLTSGIRAISTGNDHSCALTSGGGVLCWGKNDNGQLGDGTTVTRPSPVSVVGLSDVIAISTGNEHSCAITLGGGVKCWGDNALGQLGDGTTTDRHTPVNVSGLTSGAIAIATGEVHTCALISEGGVKCWGRNSSGQLGDNSTTDRLTPVDVYELASGVTAISAKFWHTCALTSEGVVKCWGYNSHGQLGDGTTTNRWTPTNVNELPNDVVAISASAWHTCAKTSDGGAICWGGNKRGQLGDGTRTDRITPVDVYGLTSGVKAISAGFRDHTCALTMESTVKCWGYNLDGQLGDGTGTILIQKNPVDVLALTERVFRSIGTQDGYIWESTETSGVGLNANSTNTTFLVGDDNSDRQYRGILSFDTSPLPDTAVIFSAEIQLRRAGEQGEPDGLNPILVDIRKPFFGASISLLPNDFQSAPSMATATTNGLKWWLKSTALPYINLNGPTQFRIRFQKDDNDDVSADYIRYYSSEAQPNFRPRLVVYYYVP